MTNLRVTDTQGYLLYREVEPVQPYPRIDPQQPQDERTRNQDESRAKKDDMARRRFVAMRALIERLKTVGRIERIDYHALVSELTKVSIGIAERELFDLLRKQQVPNDGLGHLAAQIRDRIAAPELSFGPLLTADRSILPSYSQGLSEFLLCYSGLELLPGQEGPLLIEAIGGDGLYSCAAGQLRVEFRPQVRTQYDTALEVDIRILVGVGEMDEANRRAILFERSSGVFALYTDKLISLSI